MNPDSLDQSPPLLISIPFTTNVPGGSQTPFRSTSSGGPTWVTEFLPQFP